MATEVLKRGMRGSLIEGLQAKLNEWGFGPVGTDGIFGTQTEAAVKKLQQALGVTADGIVGLQTMTAIQKALNDGTLKQSDRTTAINFEDDVIEVAAPKQAAVPWLLIGGVALLGGFLWYAAQESKSAAVAGFWDEDEDNEEE